MPDVPRGNDYRIPPGGLTREGSWLDTARRNVEIVELVNRLTQEGRPATADEQALLVKFTGWGAADIRNQLFHPRAGTFHRYNPAVLSGSWRELGERVAAVFTKEDWKTVLRSTQYAHYTSEAVVRAAWQGVERLGFAGGVILEPGAGIGHFAGLMPDGIYRESKYLGIEMDGFTAKIAQLLYPRQTIRHADYVRSKVPKMFDLAIGNPPFASTAILDDPEYARQKFPLHDYFFAKSLDRVRPGGLLVFVTSRFSLDKKGDRARRYLAERADLLGAIRLPNTAFKANAGTQVVTDILFLRRRAPGQAPAGESWLGLETMQSIEGEAVPVNEYFARHPEMILGQVTTRGDTLNPGEAFTVNPAGELEPALSEAIQRLPANVYSVAGPDVAAGTTQRTMIEKDWNPKYRKEGGLYLSDAGELMRVESGAGAPLSSLMRLTAKEQAWLTDYVGVRDALKQAQYDQLSDGDWEASLKALKKAYAAFVKQHGPMLSFTQTETVKLNKEGEEETVISRRFKNDRLLRADIDGKALMTALEVIREDGSIAPGAVLQGRVLKRPAEPKIESVDDALAVSLAQTGRFDLAHVARLAGLEVNAALERLGDLVFETPEGGHVLAEEYLSGDVRTKLDEAEAAAALHPRFARNVEALTKVQPPSLASADVTVGMGATWVPLEFYQQYAQEVVGLDKPSVKYNPVSNEFEVSSTDRPKLSRRESEEWGTAYRSPVEVFDAAMNHRTVKVYVPKEKGSRETVFSPDETKKVELLVRRMEENFSSWVWTDSQRTARVLDIYNDKFNRLAPRFFNGDHLNPPGLSLRYDLHKHQKRAIWRAIVTGNTYFAHAVGAGKTLEMIIAGMEQKRLGLINKPMYVVPNHMLEQFASEFMDAYPAANIMVADEKNFAADNRRRFIAQAALNNPDAIIITHSAFTILEMKPENMQAAFDDVIDDLRATLEELPDDFENRKTRGKIEAQLEKIERAMSGSSTERFTQRKKLQDMQKALEEMRTALEDFKAKPGTTKAALADAARIIANQEALIQAQAAKARTEELNAERDRSVLFEDMGVDFLFVDEAHEFRKLDYSTKMNIKGISPEGSVMALKLFVKTRWLEKQRPGRSFAFASGTPITNTLAELFTIQRFFQERQLRALGLIHFDAWAANFARVKTEYERNATGAWEAVDRLSKFVNVADLMAMVKQQMDVLTSSELAHLVKLPSVIQGNAGKRDILVTPRVPELDEYMSGELARRLKASREWKPSKDEPNNPDPVVAIITDGRVSALDMRYINPRLPNNPDSKLNRLADVIIQQYRETADLTYIDPETKKVEPVKGGTQIVFASLGFGPGIAQSRGFDGRAWLNKRLRAAGIPASEVAWIWDYPTAAAKQAMFKEMRQGKKRILIGSPKNMGTGVNVQKRLTHKIDVDAPWYPSDMEQPDGRILRQGNQNEWVKLVGLATDGTYDSTMYSMVARKSGFIEQAFRGDRSLRVMDDISESSQYAMAAAIASGDPRYVQMAELESAVAKLEGAKELHERRQASLRADIGRFKGNAPILQKAVESARKVQEALEGVIFYSGYFDAVVAGQSMPKVKTTDLGAAVVAVVDREYEKAMGIVQRKALEDNRLGSSEHGGPTHTHKFQVVIGTLAGKAELVLSGKVGAFRPKNKAGQLENTVSLTYESGAEVHVRVAGTVDSRAVDHWQANPPASRALAAGAAITDRLNDLQKRALERRREALDENQEALEKAERAYGAPFPEQAKLVQAVTELAQLRRELAGEGKEVPEAAVKASVLPDFSLVRAAPKGGDRQAAFLAEAYGWPGAEGGREEAVRFSRRALPETLTVDGVERPTRNSEGRPIHPTEEGVRNFWRWFGDSKVVDGQGRPVVVYHGSPSGDIDVFDAAKEGTNTGSPSDEHGLGGFYFSPNPRTADTYARTIDVEMANVAEQEFGIAPKQKVPKSTIYPVYLAIRNPLQLDAGAITRKVVNSAKAQQHDGIIKLGAYPEYVTFDSVQAKSAIGNTGAFSPTNPDIRYARKGAGAEGYTPDGVRAAIDASEGKGFAAALEKTGWFHIITGDQVPEDVRAQAGGDRVPAYTWKGEVYFVADEIHAGDSIPGLLRHEVAVHAMQLGRSDAEFRAILKAFRGMPGEAAAKARAAVPTQTPGHLRDEEALAYFIEQHPTHSLTKRFLAWLRGALRALARRLPGAERLRVVRWANTLSEDDLIAMANSALRSAVRGDGALTGEQVSKFALRADRAAQGANGVALPWATPQQEVSSAATSINDKLLPGTFTNSAFLKAVMQAIERNNGSIRIGDIGGGKFDNAANLFERREIPPVNDKAAESYKSVANSLGNATVKFLVYDPFNRSAAHNQNVRQQLQGGQADIVTSNNVANVIGQYDARRGLYATMADALKPDGVAFLKLYAGTTDVGTLTRTRDKQTGEVTESWQNNAPALNYAAEVAEFFDSVKAAGDILILQGPRPSVSGYVPVERAWSVDTGKMVNGAPVLQNYSGSKLQRGGSFPKHNEVYPVGKWIGGQLYLHKDYLSTLPAKAQTLYREGVKRLPPGFTFNTLVWEPAPKSGVARIRFDEAPDFDTANEPIPGRQFSYFEDGSTAEAYSAQIWHHKWQWVGNDYRGFDVGQSIDWSRTYLSRLEGVPNGRRDIWERQLDAVGLGNGHVAKFSRRGLPATITVEGVERPTVNSEGRPIHPTEAGVRNFWRWFAGSRVVDEQGRPLVVYHGTNADFAAFKLNRGGSGTLAKDAKKAAFFTSSAEVADDFSGYLYVRQGDDVVQHFTEGANTMPVYLRVTDPTVWQMSGGAYSEAFMADALKEARKEKSDGVIFANMRDGSISTVGPWKKSHVVVAFRSTQIKSAIGNTGAFSPTNPDIRFSRRANEGGDIWAEIDAGTRSLGPVREAAAGAEKQWHQASGWARRAWLGALTVQQLVEQGSDVLPRMQEYLRHMTGMDVTRNTVLHEVDGIAQAWEKLGRTWANRLAHVMHESTLAGVDGAGRYVLVDKQGRESLERYSTRAEAEEAAARRGGLTVATQASVTFMPLVDPAEAEARIKTLRRLQKGAGGDQKRIVQWQEEIKTLEAQLAFDQQRQAEFPRIVALYQALSPEAKAVYLRARDYHIVQSYRVEAALLAHIEHSAMSGAAKAAAMATLRQEFEAQRVQAPYFPLGRDGDYWVSVQGPDGRFEFVMFDTLEEQQAAMRDYKAQGLTIAARGKQTENLREVVGVSSKFVAEVESLIAELGVDVPEVAELRDAVYQLYLRTLPELSARKHFIHRKKTPGFGQDALRTFAKKGYHDAYQYARLKHGFELRQAMEDVLADVKASSSQAALAGVKEELRLIGDFRGEVLDAGLTLTQVKEQAERHSLQWQERLTAARMTKRSPTAAEREHEALAERWAQYQTWMENWGRYGGGVRAFAQRRTASLEQRLQSAKAINQAERGYERASDFYDELQQAYQHLMNPSTGTWANTVNQIGYLWHLAFSPAAWITNATQTPLVTMPYVAAKHGMKATTRAFQQAYREAMRGATSGKKDHALGIREALTDPKEVAAYEAALERGLIDRGRAMDLAGLAEEGAGRSGWHRKFAMAMTFGFHDAERLNREVSFMASYRLAKAGGASEDAAIEYGARVVNDTHFNYTSENRPRFLRSDLLRVLGQFKLYSQHVTYLQWRAMRQALGTGATQEETREARRFLLFQTGMQLAAGGVLGLPLWVWATGAAIQGGMAATARYGWKGALTYAAALIGAAVALGGDDDDDPKAVEAEFQQAMKDWFGETGGRVASRGLVNGLVGVDLSTRIGMADLWWREPNADAGDRALWGEILSQATGAGIGTVAQWIQGLQMAADGEVWRGVETMVPKVTKDAMQAFRLATEGAKSLKGDTLVAEFSPWEVTAKAGGFQPDVLAARYAENRAEKDRQATITERRSRILGEIAEGRIAYSQAREALETGDMAAAQTRVRAAMAELQAFNAKNPRFKIDHESIMASIKARRRARAQAKDGVFLNRKIGERYDFAG